MTTLMQRLRDEYWAENAPWSAVPQAEGVLPDVPPRRRTSRVVQVVCLGAGCATAAIATAVIGGWVPNITGKHRGATLLEEKFNIGDVFHFFEGSTSTVTETSTTSTTTTSTWTSTSTTTVTITTTTTTTSSTTTTEKDAELTGLGGLCDFEFDVPSATSPAAKCFCNLAGNVGCEESPCMCPQGCSNTSWHHLRSVTFVNKAKAYECDNGIQTALLTIPKSYMRDIGYLKFWCPRGAYSLLSEMLREGFVSYQSKVRTGVVRQCIHSGTIASVPWFHLHTIGQGGFVDNMFHTTSVVWCHEMKEAEEASDLAWNILRWAGGEEIRMLQRRPAAPPSTCAVMGCGTWGPKHHCSCDPSCRGFGICCEDYEDLCYSTCSQIGCGNAPKDNVCTCDRACKVRGDCCEDALNTCPDTFSTTTTHTTSTQTTSTHTTSTQTMTAETVSTKTSSNKTAPSSDAASSSAATSTDSVVDESSTTFPVRTISSLLRPKVEPMHTPNEDIQEKKTSVEDLFVGGKSLRASTCSAIGCGNPSAHGTCSCEKKCEEERSCCFDFATTCQAFLRKLKFS